MNQYSPLAKIGSGAQGVVYKVQKNATKQQYAMKIVCCRGQQQTDHAVQELKALLGLKHPHIVTHEDFYLISPDTEDEPRHTTNHGQRRGGPGNVKKNNSNNNNTLDSMRCSSVNDDLLDQLLRDSGSGNFSGGTWRSMLPWLGEKEIALCLVMELCNNGDMQDVIKKARLHFANTGKHMIEEATVVEWMLQCAAALEYMHSNGFVHRDLKPTNVFFDANRCAKIGDFGLATSIALDKLSAVGSPYYSAPEQKLGQQYDGRADVWGLGVVFLELLTLRDVALNNKVIEDPSCLEAMVVRPVRKMGFSEPLAQLLKRMLERQPSDRIMSDDLRQELFVLHSNSYRNARMPSLLSATQLSSPGVSTSGQGGAGGGMCDFCEVQTATTVCHLCRSAYCASCDTTRHQHPARQSHERVVISQLQTTLSGSSPHSRSTAGAGASSTRRASLDFSSSVSFPRKPFTPVSFDSSSCGATYARMFPGSSGGANNTGATTFNTVSFSSMTMSDASQQSASHVTGGGGGGVVAPTSRRQVTSPRSNAAVSFSSAVMDCTVVHVPRDFANLHLALEAVQSMPHVRQILVAPGVITEKPIKLSDTLPEGIKIIGEKGDTMPIIEVVNYGFAVHFVNGTGLLENFVIRHMGTRGGLTAPPQNARNTVIGGSAAPATSQTPSTAMAELSANVTASSGGGASSGSKKPPRPSAVVFGSTASWRLHRCRISCVDGAGVSVHGRRPQDLNDSPMETEAVPAVIKCSFVDVTTAGVVLEERAVGNFDSNTFDGCGYAAFLLRKDAAPTVRGNKITGNAETGIFCQDSQGTVEHNLIANNGGCGVVVKGRDATTIFRKNRVLANRETGFFLCDHASPYITENEIQQNQKAGILVKTRASPKIIKNKIEDSKEAGVYVFDHGEGVLQENKIRRNRNAGVLVTTGAAPHVIKNIITQNQYEGVWVCKGGSGTLSRNDLRGNHKGAMDIATDCDVTESANITE